MKSTIQTAVLVLLAVIGLCAQTCTILAPRIAELTGVYAGPPTLRVFVSGLSAALPAARSAVAGSPQPRMSYSAQVVPASTTFMTYDPHTCPVSGTCQFNNSTVIDYFIDSLAAPPPAGAGLASLDFNFGSALSLRPHNTRRPAPLTARATAHRRPTRLGFRAGSPPTTRYSLIWQQPGPK